MVLSDGGAAGRFRRCDHLDTMSDSETDRLPMRPEFAAELAEMGLVPLPHGCALQAGTLVHVDSVTAGRYGSLERAGGTVWTLAAVGAEDLLAIRGCWKVF